MQRGAPDQHEHRSGLVSLFNPLDLFSSEVLSDKGVHCHGKTTGDHPGKAFHLASHFLDRYRVCSPTGHQAGYDQRQAGHKHILDTDGKAHFPNLFHGVPTHFLEQGQTSEESLLKVGHQQKEQGHNSLGTSCGNGSSCHPQRGNGAHPKDQHRVQYQVEHQTGTSDPKGAFGAPRFPYTDL